MKTKRLFLGVYIDRSFFAVKYDKIKRDFDTVSFGKWVEPENLHFTVKFLGDLEVSKIPDLNKALEEYYIPFKSKLNIAGLDILPSKGAPRVLHVKVEPETNDLFQAQTIIEDISLDFGFEKESREFTPHVTLQRIKSSTNDLRNVLAQHKNLEFGVMPEFSINLIESVLTPRGPVYKILK